MEPEVRSATAADLAAFYGEPQPLTQRAMVVVLDGKPIGIAGVAYERGVPVALFAEMKPEMKRFPKVIVRGARRFLAETPNIKGLRASASTPEAARFLGFLGFKYIGSYGDHMIYEWGGSP